MKTTVEFLDAVKAKHSLKSDYQLAKHLNIRASRISNYRNGISLFDEETCIQIAADLGLDTGYVLACIASERSNKPEIKAAWKHTAEVLYGLAAVLAVIAVLPITPLHYDGFNVGLVGLTLPEGGALYIMSNLYLLIITGKPPAMPG